MTVLQYAASLKSMRYICDKLGTPRYNPSKIRTLVRRIRSVEPEPMSTGAQDNATHAKEHGAPGRQSNLDVLKEGKK